MNFFLEPNRKVQQDLEGGMGRRVGHVQFMVSFGKEE